MGTDSPRANSRPNPPPSRKPYGPIRSIEGSNPSPSAPQPKTALVGGCRAAPAEHPDPTKLSFTCGAERKTRISGCPAEVSESHADRTEPPGGPTGASTSLRLAGSRRRRRKRGSWLRPASPARSLVADGDWSQAARASFLRMNSTRVAGAISRRSLLAPAGQASHCAVASSAQQDLPCGTEDDFSGVAASTATGRFEPGYLRWCLPNGSEPFPESDERVRIAAMRQGADDARRLRRPA